MYIIICSMFLLLKHLQRELELPINKIVMSKPADLTSNFN